MGCGFSDEINPKQLFDRTEAMKKVDTAVGNFELKVKKILLGHVEDKTQKKRDLLLKVKISNQEYRFSVKQIYRHPQKAETMNFVINSCYKLNGRYLSIEVWSRKSGNNKDIALGMINLDQNIPQSSKISRITKTKISVPLDYGFGPAGSIQFQASFTPFNYETFKFKVLSAIMRIDTDKQFDKSKCFTRIEIGEEVLDTNLVRGESGGYFLKWKDSCLTFKVPSFLKQGKICVLERKGSSDILLGQMTLVIKNLIKSQHQFQQPIEIDENLTGKIHVLYGNGEYYRFSEPESPRNRKKISNSSRLTVESDEMLPRSSLVLHPVQNEQEASNIESNECSESLQTSRRMRRASMGPLDLKKGLDRINQRRKKRVAEAPEVQ